MQAAYTCQALDSQLDLSGSLPLVQGQAQTPVRAALDAAGKINGAPVASQSAQVTTVDLTTYACPVHFMKARLEIKKLDAGGVIDFLLESGDATQQVSESLKKEGHKILASEPQGDATRVRVQKQQAAVHAEA